MTSFPAAGDYYKAVQAPARVFTVRKLQEARFVYDTLGPTLARGSSAVVFQAEVEKASTALRCYIRNDASSRDRYSALSQYLAYHDLSPFVSGTIWLDSAIRVKGETWPVLQMGWIDGRTLNQYVDFLVTGANTAALATLAGRWLEMVARLQDSEFGHGDLQHGNVLVDQEGRIRLVDFDGVWIPQLAGQSPPTEYGHPNYQRPGLRAWDRWMDTFSALIIYTSLVALSKDPSLWLALYNSKNLLFSKGDFFAPFETQAWKQLAALHDPQVDELASRLRECCQPQWRPNRSLAEVLAPRVAPPAPTQPPVEVPWWQKQPVAPAARPAPAPAPPPAAARTVPDSAAGPPTMIIPVAEVLAAAAAALPAPPPLSAPLGEAGTGPIPRPQLTPPQGVTWWSSQGAGQSARAPEQPRAGSSSRPALPAPVPPAPVAKPQQGGPTTGAISLGLGIVILIAGAASHAALVVLLGLVAAAWGLWRLVTLHGNNTKPPGQT